MKVWRDDACQMHLENTSLPCTLLPSVAKHWTPGSVAVQRRREEPRTIVVMVRCLVLLPRCVSNERRKASERLCVFTDERLPFG